MPTYEYECRTCGLRFDAEQRISDPVLTDCLTCGGEVKRLMSGGGGFVVKGSGTARGSSDCGFTRTGRTCCGQTERCGRSSCESDPRSR